MPVVHRIFPWSVAVTGKNQFVVAQRFDREARMLGCTSGGKLAVMDKLMVALGAMEFGTRVDERTSFALLDQYVDAGGEWIDTANCYAFWKDPTGHGGASEALLGRWLAVRPGMRDRVRIATKVGCEPISPGSYPASTEGLSRTAITAAAQESLRRMVIVVAGGAGTEPCRLSRCCKADRVAAPLLLPPTPSVGTRSCERPPVRLDHRRDPGLRRNWRRADRSVSVQPLMSGAYERMDRAPQEAFDHPGTARRLAALTGVGAELGMSRSAIVIWWLSGGSTDHRSEHTGSARHCAQGCPAVAGRRSSRTAGPGLVRSPLSRRAVPSPTQEAACEAVTEVGTM